MKGQALVEAAIALPLLLVLVLGAVDLGFWLYARVQAGAAVREGARLGAVIWQDPTADQRVQQKVAQVAGSPPHAQLQTAQVSYPEGRVRGGSIVVRLPCDYAPYTPGVHGLVRLPCTVQATMRLE